MGIVNFPTQNPSARANGNASTSSTTFVTALSIVGTGKLIQFSSKCTASASGANIKITIDGTVVYNASNIGGSSTVQYIITNNPLQSNTTPINCLLSFSRSLLIEHSTNDSGATNSSYWSYELI